MTVVVGYVDPKNHNIYIGADSGIFTEDNFFVTPRPKVFKRMISSTVKGSSEKYPILVGFCGSLRFYDIIEDMDFESLKYDPKSHTPRKFIKQVLIPAIQDEMQVAKFSDKESGLLIGFGKSLFEVECDLSLMDVPKYGHAIGIGGVPARACLYTIDKLKGGLPPIEIVKHALECSERVSIYVKSPFNIMSFDESIEADQIFPENSTVKSSDK